MKIARPSNPNHPKQSAAEKAVWAARPTQSMREEKRLGKIRVRCGVFGVCLFVWDCLEQNGSG